MNDLHLSAVLGASGMLLQALPPETVGFPGLEQYGIAGLLLGAAWFMLRYFMAALKEKDEQINKLHAATLEAHTEFKNDIVKALEALTEEIKKPRT